MANISLREALEWAERLLTFSGVFDSKLDAQLLASYFLKISLGSLRSMLLLDGYIDSSYRELVLLRSRRIPLQYITGETYFRNLVLQVGPGVFIPRPETEILVDLVLDSGCGLSPVVVDLGTGSGAIAASIAAEVPGSKVYAVEVSRRAYVWAEHNLRSYSNVVLELGDLANSFSYLEGCVDVVVTNPPYIPDGEVPDSVEVSLYDPPQALYGGGKFGLDVPKITVNVAQRLLRSGGYYVVEHTESQSKDIVDILGVDSSVWNNIRVHKDLTGRERATSAWRS